VFQAVLDGEHAINGFRNRDLAKLIYPKAPSSPEEQRLEQRRRSARLSRMIAHLRGHGLVAKVKGSHP
jgi:hypothetical protein